MKERQQKKLRKEIFVIQKTKQKNAGRKSGVRIRVWLALALLLALAGCGGSAGRDNFKTTGKGAETGGGEVLRESADQNGTGAGGTGAGTAGNGIANKKVKKGQLYLLDYCQFSLREAQEGRERKLYYDTYDGKIYILAVYEGKGQERTFAMKVYDGETGEGEELPFSLQDTEDYEILSMDILPDGRLSFRLKHTKEESERMLQTDSEGKILAQEESFPDPERYPWNPNPFSEAFRKVFDFAESTVISQAEEDGTCVFFTYDKETGSREKLGTLAGETASALCENGEEGYYCVMNGKLLRWDIGDKACTELMQLNDKGLLSARTGKGNHLLKNTRGEIVFCDVEGDMPGMYFFSESRPQKEGESGLEGEIRLAELAYGMEYVEKMATRFCLKNRECSIVTERAEESSEQEAFQDRIWLELMAGKGPDLLWVYEEEMRILNDKGLLLDIGEFLSEETKRQIFPGVLAAGTLDGKLVAVTPEIRIDTLIVSDALWEKDSWTRTEFLDLLEKNRDTVEWPVTYFSNRLEYDSLLSMILLTDYSDFIDWEQGSCCFDSEEFQRILKVCKEYGKPDSVMKEEDERLAMLKDGRSIAVMESCQAGLSQFSSQMKWYGEDCHIIGFPTASGRNNHYLRSNYLVVNANTEKKEEIRHFLSYLLDYDNQYDSWFSVRRDVSWDRVVTDENTGKIGINLGSAKNPAIAALDTKPDGSTYQKEFMKLMESCVPEPETPQAVDAILRQELAYYWEGDKSVEEVTRIIQNRVQLYLNERK